MIARISPQDGHVIAWIDVTGLLPSNQRIDAEPVLSLNGIAYDPVMIVSSSPESSGQLYSS
jgi:glutaminyl-peptide cyclotransferase